MKPRPFLDRVTFIALCLAVFVLPATNAMVEVLSALMVVLFLIQRFSAGRAGFWAAFPTHKVFLPMVLFLLWSGLSIAWSHYPILSLKAFIGKSLQAMLLVCITYDVLSSVKRLRIGTMVLLFSAGIVSLDGLWQKFYGHDLFVNAATDSGRVMASFKHPNDFGAYLVFIVLPVLSLVFIFGENFFRERSFKNAGLLMLGVFLMLLVMVSLGLTLSRGAWIGVMFSCVVFLCFANRSWLFILACIIIFSAVFMPFMSHGRHVTMISDGIDEPYFVGGNGRLGFWQDASRIIYDHPVFGTGLNTYTEVIKSYAQTWKAYPHNCYLQMGAELGLVGLALFLWLLTAVFVEVSRSIISMAKAPDRWLCAAFFSGWGGVLVHSGLDTTLYSSKLSALLWIMSGALLASCKLVREGSYGKA